MKITRYGTIGLFVFLTSCATSDLPRGARLVGGGLDIQYRSPSDGTAILRERTSGRIIATESLEQGNDFVFGPNYAGCSEVLVSMFAATNVVEMGRFPQVPTNTLFELYFVPAKALKD